MCVSDMRVAETEMPLNATLESGRSTKKRDESVTWEIFMQWTRIYEVFPINRRAQVSEGEKVAEMIIISEIIVIIID